MKTFWKKFLHKIERFFDELGLAGRGFLLLTRKKGFLLPFLITFFAFSLLFGLLENGLSSFRLLFSGHASLALSVLKDATLGIFGVGKKLPDFLLNFSLSLIQAVLISLVLFVFRHNRAEAQSRSSADHAKISNGSSGLESSALVAGLAILGSGCPTCGTTLLAPLLGTVLSGVSGSVALAGKLALLFNLLAVGLSVFVFRKLGLETYAIIKSEQYLKKKREHHS